MLDCPHLRAAGPEHRLIETCSVLLYLQTPPGGSVSEGSSLEGQRQRGIETPWPRLPALGLPSLLRAGVLEASLKPPQVTQRTGEAKCRVRSPVLSPPAPWYADPGSGALMSSPVSPETGAAGSVTDKTRRTLGSHGPSPLDLPLHILSPEPTAHWDVPSPSARLCAGSGAGATVRNLSLFSPPLWADPTALCGASPG